MKKGILVASFGTTFREAREKSIAAIEQTISSAYPEYAFYRAFTSGIVRRRILEKEGTAIDSVSQALEHMKKAGIEEVWIQPTHMIPGEEYNKVKSTVDDLSGSFHDIHMGKPLLGEPLDFTKMADILDKHYRFSEHKENEAFVLMGHGTSHPANSAYQSFQTTLQQKGLSHVLLPTVEGKPDFSQIMELLTKSSYRKVTLLPFMIVAGDHVNNDLFGEDKTSWKNRLLAAGYEVDGQPTGLGEIPAVQKLFLSHFQDMLADGA